MSFFLQMADGELMESWQIKHTPQWTGIGPLSR